MATKTYNLSHVVGTSAVSSLIAALLAVTLGIPAAINLFSPYNVDKRSLQQELQHLNENITRLEKTVERFATLFQSHETRISTLEGKIN